MYSLPILELLQDSYDPPLTLQSIEELEIELGARFPQDYIEFLLQFNGGEFSRPVMFYLPNPTQWIDGVGVNAFLGEPGDRVGCHGISWYSQTLKGRIPDDTLAIAHCNSLDLVLLEKTGPNSNLRKIAFWDGVAEGEGNNVHWLADSFAEFLSLLQYDTDYDDEERESVPIFQAVERGNLKAVERFLAAGGDVASRNGQGQTLLAAAAIYSWPKILRLLLERGADPNSRDEQGRTPLHHAATHSIDGVKLLLAAGADATVRDCDGRGVLAQWSYRADQMLRAHGARE